MIGLFIIYFLFEGAGDLKADLCLEIGVCCYSSILYFILLSCRDCACWEQVKAELYIYIGYFKLCMLGLTNLNLN